MRRDKVCTLEIWCEIFGGDLKKMSPYESSKISTVLGMIENWIPYENNGEKLSFGDMYGMQKAYVRKVEESDI